MLERVGWEGCEIRRYPRASSGKDRRLLIQLNKCLSPSEQLERQAEVHSCTQDKA